MAFSKKTLLLALFLLINFAIAAPNTNNAADWLSENADYEQNIESVSFAILALGISDREGEAQRGATRLLERQDPEGCWPKGSCRVKDTSLAVLALSEVSQSTFAARSWLNSLRLPASTTGKFWIQIAASSDGQCTLKFDGKQKIFTLNNGNIKECGNQPWIEANCIDPNLLKDMDKEIEVDCSNLQSSAIISLIFQKGNSYYILQEQHSNLADLTLSNACLPARKGSNACDYDSTLYASLAMKNLGQDIGTQTYLESSIQSNNIPGYSILYVLTGKEIYRDILVEKQLASGSFSNVFQTGLAMLALQNTPAGNNASSWLELQQQEDGSFNRNMRDTSSVIYGSLFSGFVGGEQSCVGQGNLCCSSCSEEGNSFGSLDNTCNTGQVCCSECQAVVFPTCSELGGIECGFDEKCADGDFQESKDSIYCCVAGTCEERTSTTTTILPTCNFDKQCDFDETEDSCPEDCGKKSNKLFWIIIMVFAVLIIAGVVFLFKKKPELFRFKRKAKIDSKFPTQRPAYPVTRPAIRRPQQSAQPTRPISASRKPIRTKIEKELEKSLAEAKKILKSDKK